MLVVQPYAGGESRLFSKVTPHAGGTDSCILMPHLRCRYKQLLYTGWHKKTVIT